MTWGDVKADIVETMAYDGDTSKALSVTGRAVGTATDNRLQVLLRNFSVEIFCFYTRAVNVTFVDGDWDEIDLTNFSRCALSMSKVMKLSFNAQFLRKTEGVALLERRSSQSINAATGIPNKATPVTWAESEKGKVSFDVPVSMTGNPPAWVAGWYRHPVLTSDSGGYLLDETIHFAFCKYAAISLKENVTTVQAGMERLKRFDLQAFDAVQKKSAENMARYQRGNDTCHGGYYRSY